MLNAQARAWLRAGFGASALVAAGAAGFLVAAHPRAAAADGLLPTTVSVPTLPVTLPTVPTVSLPVGTTTTAPVTTTTPASTTTPSPPTTTSAATAPTGAGGAAGAGGSTTSGTASGTADPVTATTAGVTATAAKTVAGSLRLPGGAISIPVTSVAAPNRLVLAVTLAPRITRIAAPVAARIQVRDASGRLVRGAAVAIRSAPGGMLQPLSQQRSAPDGRASFVVRGKAKALGTRKRLWLLVTATDPARPKAVSVSRLVAVSLTAHSNG